MMTNKQSNKLSKGQRKRLNKNLRKMQELNLVTGNGGYYSEKIVPFMKKIIPDGSFANAGEFLGSNIANNFVPGSRKIGGSLGKKFGGGLSTVLGFGDYTVNENSLLTKGHVLPEGNDVPMFINSKFETRIQHREYVQDVSAPASPLLFNNTTFQLTPANSSLFPWLSTIAPMYQQYRINGMIVEYKTLSSDITAGGALGSVIMATNYDSVNSSFVNKIVMENSEYATSSKPSRTQLHTIECDPKLRPTEWLYVLDATLGSTTYDPRFYQFGNFQLATCGLPSTTGTVLGELWVTYDISFIKPQISTNIVPSPLLSMCIKNSAPDKANVFNGATFAGASLVQFSNNTITFPTPGQYVVTYVASGTALNFPNPTGSVTFQVNGNAIGTNLTVSVVTVAVLVTAPSQYLTINVSASTTLIKLGCFINSDNYIVNTTTY